MKTGNSLVLCALAVTVLIVGPALPTPAAAQECPEGWAQMADGCGQICGGRQCMPNEHCTADAQCAPGAPAVTAVPTTTAAVPTTTATIPVVTQTSVPVQPAAVPVQPGYTLQYPAVAQPPDPGWAVGAGVLGIIGTLAIGGALTAALLIGDDSTSIALGAAVVGLVGVTGPIIAVGAGSARGHPQVRGAVALRVVSWIAYGITMFLGITEVVLAAVGDTIPASVAIPTVALAAVTELGFAIDAFVSANQATSISF